MGLEDLAYYVRHRCWHKIAVLWSIHQVHHQPKEFNLAVAIRVSWIHDLIMWPFVIPFAFLGLPVKVMVVSYLGGGSVFNSAICMRAPSFALERWVEEHGVDGLTAADLERHFVAVEDFMGVRRVVPEVQGKRNELFRQGCEAMGWNAEAIARSEEGCRGSGQCFTGCRNGAKRSVDVCGVPEILQDRKSVV